MTTWNHEADVKEDEISNTTSIKLRPRAQKRDLFLEVSLILDSKYYNAHIFSFLKKWKIWSVKSLDSILKSKTKQKLDKN